MSIDKLFKSWINWPDSWNVEWDDGIRTDCLDEEREGRSSWGWKWHERARIRAGSIVSAAIRGGLLPDLRKTFVKCSDCHKRADCYDHRDYLEPLDVTPVCTACNGKRGPASFMLPPQQDDPDRAPNEPAKRNPEISKRYTLRVDIRAGKKNKQVNV